MTGAPKVLLHFMRWLKRTQPEVTLDTLLMKGGVMVSEYEALGKVYLWKQPNTLLNKVSQKLLSTDKKGLSGYQRKIVKSIDKEGIH